MTNSSRIAWLNACSFLLVYVWFSVEFHQGTSNIHRLQGRETRRCLSLWIWDLVTLLTVPCKLLPNAFHTRNFGMLYFILWHLGPRLGLCYVLDAIFYPSLSSCYLLFWNVSCVLHKSLQWGLYIPFCTMSWHTTLYIYTLA